MIGASVARDGARGDAYPFTSKRCCCQACVQQLLSAGESPAWLFAALSEQVFAVQVAYVRRMAGLSPRRQRSTPGRHRRAEQGMAVSAIQPRPPVEAARVRLISA